tara:strand:- start:2386 stop:3843 length:1458 start_codon:yes stop_codon:yes gene_type:complete
MTTKNIKINVDTKDAVKETDKLTNSFDNLEKETGKTSNSLKDVGDNGGAIAILDSLTGGLATQMRDAFEATKLFNFSLKGTRTALIATGVGAFVVALGLVVAYWDDIVRFIENANEKLLEQKVLIDNQLDIVKLNLETNDLLEKSYLAQGKSIEGILKIKDKILQSEQFLLIDSLQNLIQQRSLLDAKSKELSLVRKIGNAERERIGLAPIFNKISEEDRLALEALDKQITEINNALILLGITRDALANPNRGETIDPIDDPKEGDDGRSDFEKTLGKRLRTEADERKSINDLILSEEQRLSNAEIDLRKVTRDEMLKIEQSFIDARQDIQTQGVNDARSIINLFSQLAGENKKLQAAALIASNAAGIAQNIIDTNASNARLTLEAGVAAPALITANFVRMGIGIASSIAATAQGLAALKAGGSPTGGQSGARGSAPSFNLVQGTQGNQIANSLNSQAPIQTFVVGTAVTSQQSLDRNSESNGTL